METYSSVEDVIAHNLEPLIGKEFVYLYDLQGLAQEVSDYDSKTQKYVVDEALLQDHLEAGTFEKKYLNILSYARRSVLNSHIYDTEGLLNQYGLTQEQYDWEVENQFMRTEDALDYIIISLKDKKERG